jgi:capsid portal protein
MCLSLADVVLEEQTKQHILDCLRDMTGADNARIFIGTKPEGDDNNAGMQQVVPVIVREDSGSTPSV